MYSKNEYAIEVSELGKCYQIYERPSDRLKQMLYRGSRKYYKEFWALNGVSFKIKKGETVGIIGRNGSGKSTLLQMICGTVTPTVGTISRHGRIAALLELGAGFNTEFTGRENVLLNAAILGFPKETMEERMAQVHAFSELGDFIDQPVKTYSSGMYARLAFSIAIHVDPEILIIDEALAVGDSRFVAKCMRRIKDIQARGVSILFVSHDVGSVRTLCDRAIWLDKGTFVEDGDVFPVTGRYMEYMFKDDETEEQNSGNIKTNESIIEIGEINNNSIYSCKKNPNEITKLEKNVEELDSRPVTHWGSRTGIIKYASICNDCNEKIEVAEWGKPIQVAIRVNIPNDIPREDLSIAFSIKDLKGTDIIVSTTHDLGTTKIPNNQTFTILFKFLNILTTGNYLLVAAVENRKYRDIHYYEYIEGAHYFSSITNSRFFGIVQPIINQYIQAE